MSAENMSPQALAEACAEALYSTDNASKGLGMKIESVAPGRAVLSMKIRDDMVNGHGICHGGFTFALADSAFAFACNSRNANTVGQGCSIEYVRPVRQGEQITATAEERHLGKRSGLYDITIVNEHDEVVAYFRGNSCRIKGTVLPDLETK